jgi:hypothetical protein
MNSNGYKCLSYTEIKTHFILFVCLSGFLRQTDTVEVIWPRSSFTWGGRPQMPFRALFQARTDT